MYVLLSDVDCSDPVLTSLTHLPPSLSHTHAVQFSTRRRSSKQRTGAKKSDGACGPSPAAGTRKCRDEDEDEGLGIEPSALELLVLIDQDDPRRREICITIEDTKKKKGGDQRRQISTYIVESQSNIRSITKAKR